ncbi:tudor domain-containing protein 15-like [Diretmus argenteus]
MIQLQEQLSSRLTDQENRARRQNIRLFGVPEGSEDNTTVTAFLEEMFTSQLELNPSTDLNIERAHRALVPKPTDIKRPRSIVAKFMSYKTKEEILKLAWAKKGLTWKGNRINIDNDYAPETLNEPQSELQRRNEDIQLSGGSDQGYGYKRPPSHGHQPTEFIERKITATDLDDCRREDETREGAHLARCPDSGPSAPCALWPVDLKLTHLNWDPEAALIHFQGQYLTICELDYIILQTEIQNRPKTKAAVDIGEFCLVEDVTSACWYRGRVQKRREDLFDVFLIDHGNVLSVDIAHVSLCSNDLFSLPPKIVCGFLANVLLFQDCCSSAVEQYFSTLIGQNVTGYIQALLPHKVLIVEAIDINNNLIKLGFGRRMDTDTFLLLVEMLTDVPLKQNIKPVPDLLIEKPRGQEFSFKPSSLSGYEDIIAFCGPRLRVGTRVKVRVTAAVNPRLFYCQMTSMEMELRAMSAQLATACESRSKDPRQESAENLGLFCSVKRGKDEKWYRGFLQFLPINSQVRVRYVDYGFCESVKVENVQRLPPDFLSTPIMAFPCSLSSMTDQDEAVKTQQLSFLQRGLLGGVLDAEICSFDEEQNLYSITVVHADDNSHTKEPNPIQELPKIKIETALEQMPPEGGYFYYKAVMAEALGKSLQTEEVQVDSVFVGYVEHVLNPNHFWIRTQKRNHDFEVMMEEMFDYFCQVKLDEDVLENPELGTLCCAMYENDMHFYRGVVVDTLKHGAEVLFIDFGNIEKVPHMLIKKIPERFASEPPFALCCTLNVIPVLVDVWTTANSAFFRKAVSNRALRVNVVHLRKDTFVVDLYPMGSDDDQSITELLISSNQADYLSHIPSETVKQKTKEVTRCQALLVEQGLAREVNVSTKLPSSICPDSFIYSSFNLRSGSEEQVYITHVSSPWEVYCQLDKNNEIIEELEKKVSVVSEEMMQADTSAVVGKLCLAKYLDGKWYRGLAHPVPSPLHLAVFFVDYGNETLSEKINVMFIPCDSAELLFTPMQAVRCRLAQVPKEELYAEVKQWLYETIINKNVRAVVVGKSEDGSIEIELFDGDVHINEKVKELILSLTPKPKTVVSVHIDDTKIKHKQTPIKRHTFGRRTSSNPPKSNAHGCSHVQNVGCKSKANAMRCVPKKPQTGRKGKQPEHHDHIHPKSEQLPHAEEMPKLSSLPDNKVNAGFSAKCYISHIDSVKSFFLQMQEDEPSILKMCHDLNPGLCRDSLTKTNPVALRINDLVLAEYEEDGALYRAVVKGYEGSARFKVEFVDYGNSAVMARERIYPITREYLSQPRFSIPCSLLDTSTYETDASFTDAVMEKPLMVKFVSRFGTHWEVKIEILDGETASPVLNEATAETGNVTEKGREATASPTSSSEMTQRPIMIKRETNQTGAGSEAVVVVTNKRTPTHYRMRTCSKYTDDLQKRHSKSPRSSVKATSDSVAIVMPPVIQAGAKEYATVVSVLNNGHFYTRLHKTTDLFAVVEHLIVQNLYKCTVVAEEDVKEGLGCLVRARSTVQVRQLSFRNGRFSKIVSGSS